MIRKLAATQIFDGYQFLPGNTVLVSDSGKIVDLLPLSEAGSDIEFLDGILVPGFINCHCHLELSHLHAKIARQTGLPEFLLSVMQLRSFPQEEIQTAMQLADEAMYQSGIVAVGDICNTAHSITVKQKSKLLYYNFIETMGIVEEGATQRYAQAEKLLVSFQQAANRQFLGQSIVPHAPYSVSQPLLDKIAEASPQLWSIHWQESEAEMEFLQKGTGEFLKFYQKARLPYESAHNIRQFWSAPHFYQPLKKLNDKKGILVHNVEYNNNHIQAAQTDIDFSNFYWCLCPSANQYISNKLPSLSLMLEQKQHLVLGTDSLASNDQLDIVAEMRILKKAFPNLPLEVLLQAATINGAHALQIAAQFGSFETGKKPGFVLLKHDLSSSRIL